MYESPNIQEYEKWVFDEYHKLLSVDKPEEKIFQHFFEQNPCLVPGAKSHFPGNYLYNNPTGHGPFRNALITEPKIKGARDKIADFLWLSYDSAEFCPVFVEIEIPSKKYFNKNETPTAQFTQALNQIKEWKSILNDPTNRLNFYKEYDIPSDLRDTSFSPIFVLIYGSSKIEFKSDSRLSKKRKDWEHTGEIIMSFDRIELSYAHRDFITCEVKNGKYYAKYINPLSNFEYTNKKYIEEIIDLDKAIDKSVFINQDQKNHLKESIDKKR